MAGDVLEVMAEHSHALILIGPALGGIATNLIPTVQKITDSGVAVFVLTDNPGAGHGVLRIVDQPQVNAIAAGATYLEKANILDEAAVRAAIELAVAEGLRGADLAQRVKSQFAYGEGEAKPVSDLGTEAGLAKFHARVDKEMGL